MSEKIYEFKDNDNWFVGKWNGYNSIEEVGNLINEDLARLNQVLSQLNTNTIEEQDWDNFGYAITVIKKSSDFSLISFVLDMINQETSSHLLARRHNGAILISDGSKVRAVILPKDGLKESDLFSDIASTAPKKLLVATHNKGKTEEFKALFAPLGYEVEDLNAYPELPEVKETGTTFEENARLKAESISKLTGKMVLADDSGLKVDILGGLPGVWSARFSGPDATDEKNNAKLLHELSMVFEQKDRSAQFHTTLVVAAPDCDSLVVEADWPGYIAFQPKGENGFGYDPLFIVGETGKHSAELSSQEKNALSHRGQAVKKLVEVFPKWQAKLSL
ncbi:nucleoside-triphosphate diphosphatase [Streptococcus iniae]|uniref:dITP/XTP pyrophosphatase n=1 Tax=Streptococcus iniae TaxID=1346 RepID=A0A3L8GHA0_STRIN|nr:nucleoside-triphosphate diphosphatase [Streptococcus iniae]AHY16273.1 deoxyribonucleotide triphosphate pyrophosphatase [Streptococcus iniae]AJG26423.1 deoxyribonucleotide triphosphate pyrophosphatase [Streptococcus iniae]APD32300.1 non-canonical purine NTP pyrophosphatase [Streptococcus iniae]ASL35261.1 HAM1-like protein [Streptococcus iniae]ATX38258.1 dITP/XTP pyrophosphatase [Streptococcus iniae]